MVGPWLVLGSMVVALWVVVAACSSSDVGTCCSVLPGRDMTVIPKPDKSDAGSGVYQGPELNCDSLSCVSYEGSEAYCTQPCISSASCPSGYTCETVLHAMPPPNPDGGMADTKFCVKMGLTQCIK